MIMDTLSCYCSDTISSRILENPPEPLLLIHSFEQIHWRAAASGSQWESSVVSSTEGALWETVPKCSHKDRLLHHWDGKCFMAPAALREGSGVFAPKT